MVVPFPSSCLCVVSPSCSVFKGAFETKNPSTAHSIHATQGSKPRPVFGRLPLPDATLHAWLLLSIVLDRIITGQEYFVNRFNMFSIYYFTVAIKQKNCAQSRSLLCSQFSFMWNAPSVPSSVKIVVLFFPLFFEAYMARSAFSSNSSSGAAPSMRPILSVI